MRRQNRRRRASFSFQVALLLGALISLPLPAAEQDWQSGEDQRRLQKAGIDLKDESLLTYLQKQTPTQEDRARIQGLIQQMGARSWHDREQAFEKLAQEGRPALALLSEAQQSPDREIAWRAAKVMTKLEKAEADNLIAATARQLARQNPEGTVQALLNFIPWAKDEGERDVLLHSLVQAGIREKKVSDRILQAIQSGSAGQRAAAAYVLGSTRPLPLDKLSPLLKDPSVEVRFRAAHAMVLAKKKAGVGPLIRLLNEVPNDSWCWNIEDLLFCMAEAKEAPLPLKDFTSKERLRATQEWRKWWAQRADTLKLDTIEFENPERGLTLYCEYDGGRGGRVWLANAEGKQMWEVGGLSGPNDAQLLSRDRILVAERNGNRVTERDTTGKILWEKKVPDSAIAAQRLRNGDTLITTWNSILRVNRAGSEIWQYRHSSGMRYTCQLRNRVILGVASNGEIVELTPEGRLIRKFSPEKDGNGAGYWASVQKLPNGNYLVALGSRHKVVEIDSAGKIQWEAAVSNAVYALRLRDGTTLVCNFEARQIVKLDRTGRELSRETLSGRPFVVRRY